MADENTSAREQVNKPWSRLSTLPSTSWKMVSGTILVFLTTFFMFGLIIYLASKNDATHVGLIGGLIDSTLLFVATAASIVPATMFGVKRATFKPGSPDDKRSDLDIAATTADVAAEAEKTKTTQGDADVRN